MTIRVLLADDQETVRAGFRMILDNEPDIEVVGEAADGETAVRQATALRPDVAVLDIRMPGLDGIEATRLLAGPAVPDPLRIVVVTTYDTDANVYTALRAGAVGFLLKDAGPSLLIDAVRQAHLGESLISPAVLLRLLGHWSADPPRRPGQAAAPAAPGGRPPDPLTGRERDIVREVARGRTNAELAAELAISVSTVKTHLGGIQRKLGARNRTEIAIWAWENGYVR
ncbi:response regulator transcription factor [Actinoplanes sp. NPDC051411]|uniref:response regulator transcription factor n=1 Tax=Actinoplanes sp. NPDC051411 TaxID=3155522 RepID=UPI003446DA92